MWKYNRGNVFKISNDYILKSLFSYLDYHHFLKLIKNNKQLQKRLEVNIDNYRSELNFPIYEYVKITEKSPTRSHQINDPFTYYGIRCCILYITCLFFTYSFIYTILLVILDLYDGNYTKINYDESKVNKITLINKLLFILDIAIVIYPFLLIFFIINNCYEDSGIIKYAKFSIILFFQAIHLLFEVLIIWKLAISYQIKNDGTHWFIVMDYIFIILNFFYNIYFLYNIIIFLKESGSSYETTINFMLTSFNNIKINNYFLPQNFGNFNKKKRKKYVLENYDKYIYEILDRQYDLINAINVLRMKNNIPKLKFSLKENIPTFMIKKPVDIILYPTKNIFELSNKTYLFRYPVNEFKYY